MSMDLGAAEGQDGVDSRVILKMAGGDLKAMERLYDHFSGAVYALILRTVGREPEAEEIVQEVFLQAWRDASRYDVSRGSVAAWLFTIARTRSIDHLRARARRPMAATPVDESRGGEPAQDSLARVADEGPEPDVIVVDRDLTRRIRQVMASLPEVERLVLEKVYFEGLTHSEVAEATGWPIGTVKSRMARAMKALREVLAGITEGEED